MKVLHVITGLGVGGAEAVLYRVCAHDLENKHYVISLTDGGKYERLLTKSGVVVVCLHLRKWWQIPHRFFRLTRLIREFAPDAVQTWMYHADLIGGLASRLAGVTNLSWGIRNASLDAGVTSFGTRQVARVCAALSRYIPRRIVCVAESSRRAHSEFGYSSDRMVTVQNGYDFSKFKPDPLGGCLVRRKLNVDEDVFLIGCIARYDPVKGHVDLLDALTLLGEIGSSLHAVFVGEGVGKENAELSAAVKSRGLSDQVSLYGPTDDVPSIMNALDTLVVASRGEGFPNVIAEAMSCEVPCISTDVGDAGLIIDSSGLIVQPARPDQLAEALSVFVNEKGSRQWIERKACCRQLVMNRFSVDKMVHGFAEVWRQAV